MFSGIDWCFRRVRSLEFLDFLAMASAQFNICN